jgi:hypothetical protein
MFSAEIRKMFIQVISSWQVIAATVVLVIYIFLINYVVRFSQRRSRRSVMPKVKAKSKKAEGQAAETDELNLEEQSPE